MIADPRGARLHARDTLPRANVDAEVAQVRFRMRRKAFGKGG